MPHKNLDVIRKIFILSMGRSGTFWLHKLLATVGDIGSYHGILPLDGRIADLILAGDINKAQSLIKIRFNIANQRMLDNDIRVYIEVNQYMNFFIDYVYKVYNNSVFLALVRDGRDVVSSWMSRGLNECAFYPSKDDPYYEKWKDMDLFERFCWAWNYTYTKLIDRSLMFIKLERLIESYDYVQTELNIPLDIHITYENWISMLSKKFNLNSELKNYSPFPNHKDWNNDLEEKFWSICGNTMSLLKYS